MTNPNRFNMGRPYMRGAAVTSKVWGRCLSKVQSSKFNVGCWMLDVFLRPALVHHVAPSFPGRFPVVCGVDVEQFACPAMGETDDPSAQSAGQCAQREIPAGQLSLHHCHRRATQQK